MTSDLTQEQKDFLASDFDFTVKEHTKILYKEFISEDGFPVKIIKLYPIYQHGTKYDGFYDGYFYNCCFTITKDQYSIINKSLPFIKSEGTLLAVKTTDDAQLVIKYEYHLSSPDYNYLIKQCEIISEQIKNMM